MAAKKKASPRKGARRSPARPRKAPKPTAGPALPAADGDVPLHELTRDELSVFLYAALLPEENLQIARELRLSVPGFRTEGLSEVERCDLIADEVRAVPEARGRILDAIRHGFGRPPLVEVGLDERGARDLLDVGTTEHGMVLALWRVLADPSPGVRSLAKPLLARMVAEYYGPAPEGVSPEGDVAAGELQPEVAGTGRGEALQRELDRARAQAERVRQRGEERAEKLQAQLKEARAAEAKATADAARHREAAEQAGRTLRRTEEALAAARSTDAAVEAHRARQEARDLEGRLLAADARAERAEAEVLELERALDSARRRVEEAQSAPAAVQAESEEPEEPPASWLLPVYTREFYDSLSGWERRVQRAAFKQAHLLAQDHRHPSLRALPLEGLPGYYRVRVATDVRLIYRRGSDQGAVEILSLIDREDLDRYVRQAKTRD